SVLSSGSWYKFYVEKSGVYRLSRSFLSQLGINTNVDPRTIKIFGNGGAMLPFENTSNYPLDLTENAVKFVGEQDGVFNSDDYILFYAEGPKGNIDDTAINTNINPYTDKSYYFVNVSNGNGKRIQSMPQPEAPADFVVNTFQDYQFHELDEFNLVRVGRRWFGNRFNIENEQQFTFDFPNIITTEPVRVKVFAASTSENATSMTVNVNGNLVDTFTFNPIDSPTLATGDSFNNIITATSSEVVVTL